MATQWYIHKNDQIVGPLSGQQLRELAMATKLRPNDMVRNGEHGDFVEAARINNLFGSDKRYDRPTIPDPATALMPPELRQEWFVRRGDKVRGPLTSEEMKQLVAKGIVARSDMIRKSENSEWRNAGTIKGLFAAESAMRPTLPPLISVDRTPATAPPPLPLNMAEKLTAASPLVNSTGDDIEKLKAQNTRSSEIRNAVWVTCFLVLFALKGIKFYMQDKPRATKPQASAQKLLKTAEEEHIVAVASSEKAQSLIANRNAESARTASEATNRGPSAVPTVTTAASAKMDSTKSDEKKDLSVDFANLDIGKIDYSMGPHGERIEERVTYGGLTRFYRGRDGNEYLHGEQIKGDSPSVIEKYAFGMKVYLFLPMSLDNTMCSEMWFLGGGREKLIEWGDKRRGLKLHEDERLNGELHGWEMWWDDNGELTSKNRYENGEIVELSK